MPETKNLETKHVKDYRGKLILRSKARRIDGLYYEEGVTCIFMPDDKWYRTNTDKIRFNWETHKWTFTRDAANLIQGLVDDGTLGWFTETDKNVKISYKKDAFIRQTKLDIFGQDEPDHIEGKGSSWIRRFARNEEIALKYGFMESIYDGNFYKRDEMSATDISTANKPGLPTSEKSNTYSLDDDQETRKKMEKAYDTYKPIIDHGSKAIAHFIPYTFGKEYESSTGFLPARWRNPLGVRALRDGSISGIEYVTIPLQGAKGFQTTKELCEQLTKRCLMDVKCSVHVHFGNVRRDKLYIISLWRLAYLIQTELLAAFPFSRMNSVRGDGKVYCKPLPDLDLTPNTILNAKSAEDFKKITLTEFNKIYAFLNNSEPVGKIISDKRVKEEKVGILAGKEQKLWRITKKVVCYSTKNKTHAIRGHKWERPQRYFWINLLPTFFSNAETIEFRVHEATMNYERVAMYMLICTAILEYAKDTKKVLSAKKISMIDVLSAYLPAKAANHIKAYLDTRTATFKTTKGEYRANWEDIEDAWLKKDNRYKFNNISIEELL